MVEKTILVFFFLPYSHFELLYAHFLCWVKGIFPATNKYNVRPCPQMRIEDYPHVAPLLRTLFLHSGAELSGTMFWLSGAGPVHRTDPEWGQCMEPHHLAYRAPTCPEIWQWKSGSISGRCGNYGCQYSPAAKSPDIWKVPQAK